MLEYDKNVCLTALKNTEVVVEDIKSIILMVGTKNLKIIFKFVLGFFPN